MKIYIVTSGSYSDYGINAVFTDKENAEKYSSRLKDGQVEEYESDTIDPNLHAGKDLYYVYFDWIGNCGNIYKNHGFDLTVEHLSFYNYVKNYKTSKYKPNQSLLIYVWAENEDLAKKIACDRRRQLIAENKIELPE